MEPVPVSQVTWARPVMMSVPMVTMAITARPPVAAMLMERIAAIMFMVRATAVRNGMAHCVND